MHELAGGADVDEVAGHPLDVEGEPLASQLVAVAEELAAGVVGGGGRDGGGEGCPRDGGRDGHDGVDVEIHRGAAGVGDEVEQRAAGDAGATARARGTQPGGGRRGREHEHAGVDGDPATLVECAAGAERRGVGLLQEVANLRAAVPCGGGHVHAVAGGTVEVAGAGHGRHALGVEIGGAAGEVEEHITRRDEHAAGDGPADREEVLEHEVEERGGEPFAGEAGRGRKELARGGVGGQAATVAAAVEHEHASTGEGVLEGERLGAQQTSGGEQGRQRGRAGPDAATLGVGEDERACDVTEGTAATGRREAAAILPGLLLVGGGDDEQVAGGHASGRTGFGAGGRGGGRVRARDMAGHVHAIAVGVARGRPAGLAKKARTKCNSFRARSARFGRPFV